MCMLTTTRGAPRYATLFDNLFLETLDQRYDLPPFGLRHLECREGCSGMTEEHAPIALADAHASMALRRQDSQGCQAW